MGGGWWLNPESARPLLDPILARAASVDSVIALYPSDGDRGLTGAWGYTWGRVAGWGWRIRRRVRSVDRLGGDG